jgi:hypothetical protein
MYDTLLDHLLDSTCRIDLHSGEVIEAVHLGGVFGELLAKCVRQIVCWIG